MKFLFSTLLELNVYFVSGQSDIPLSGLGERQAQLVAERLQNERFTHIFSSDLSRAHETAKAISNCNRVCRCDIALDRRLRERVILIFAISLINIFLKINVKTFILIIQN